MTTYWPLVGVLVVVVGLVFKRNPMLVVVVAGIVSGVAAGRSAGDLLTLLGTSFIKSRSLMLFALTLPVIGVLERAGLRELASRWILGFARLTLARLLIAYLGLRQILGMIGLWTVAGHPQTVRPLLAPMSEATAARKLGALDDPAIQEVRAMAAATDNVGLFFGEDVFVAFGAVVLIQSVYEGQGIHLDPSTIGLWALPTAITAFVIHSVRIAIFQLQLERRLAQRRAAATPAPDEPPC